MPTPPMIRRPEDYGNPAGALDALIGQYIQMREADKAKKMGYAQQGLGLAAQGIDPSGVNFDDPGDIAKLTEQFLKQKKDKSARESEMMAQKEAESYASRRKDMAQGDLAIAQAGAAKNGHGSAPSGLLDQGDGTFISSVTGMRFRAKPGHKGNEYVPLPGQTIGADGRVVFTTSQQQESRLSAEAAKTANNAESGLSALKDIKTIMSKPDPSMVSAKNLVGGGGAFADFTTKMFGGPDSQILLGKVEEVKDVLARLRTGATITENEEKIYARKLNARFKDPAAVKVAIDDVEKFLQSVSDDMRAGKRSQASGNIAKGNDPLGIR